MLRMSLTWLAALFVAVSFALLPAKALAGWRWDYYDGRFLISDHGYGHEYAAFNPSCAWLRRVVLTPVGPRHQLVAVCF